MVSSGSLVQPYQYVGKEGYYRESQLDLYLLGQRWYEASVGRFISPSPFIPIDYREIINPYVYVINNPIFWIDPYGLDRKKPNWGTITIGIIEIGGGLGLIGGAIGTIFFVPEITPFLGSIISGAFLEGFYGIAVGLTEVINGIYGNPPISGQPPFIFIAPPSVVVFPPPQIIQQISKNLTPKPPNPKNCE